MSLGRLFQQLDLALSANGTPLTEPLRQMRVQRGNTPSGAMDHIRHSQLSAEQRNQRLWVVDRILEPQTIPHFMECAMHGQLPNGQQACLPRLSWEVVSLMQQPLSAWAPPPYNKTNDITLERIGVRIGSHEDSSRLLSVSKELHSMKSRLWEGIMPLSDRRWQDLNLDSPDNFSEACQYLCAVTNVFHYLNHPVTKMNLRQTYNLIWGHLKTFEDALNAKKAAQNKPAVLVVDLWHEYMRALYDSISTRAHYWVITRINRLRDPILLELSALPRQNPHDTSSPRMWNLTNKLHDLLENAAQADTAIFLPMDGYKGEGLPSQDSAPPPPPPARQPYREQPITYSANTLTRKADYYCRLKYLSRIESWANFDVSESEGTPEASVLQNLQDVSHPAYGAYSQVRAQRQAQMELRGEPRAPDSEGWINEVLRHLEVPKSGRKTKFVAYRISHDHTGEEWDNFKDKLQQDIARWGDGLKDIDRIKAHFTIEWRDVSEFGVADNNVQAIKKHFESLRNFGVTPPDAHTDIILAADKAVIDSYLHPTPGQGGFILAVDMDFDPAVPGRADESPGYDGTLRILGSLLWDDLSPLVFTQTQFIDDLWPLAMHHPRKVYQGPVTGPIRP